MLLSACMGALVNLIIIHINISKTVLNMEWNFILLKMYKLVKVDRL